MRFVEKKDYSRQTIDFVTDSIGDAFSRKYGRYASATPAMVDTLIQLEKNYEEAFDEEPTKEMMQKALRFIVLLFAEIGETCPGTVKARAASELSLLINEDDPVETAENISAYRTR